MEVYQIYVYTGQATRVFQEHTPNLHIHDYYDRKKE